MHVVDRRSRTRAYGFVTERKKIEVRSNRRPSTSTSTSRPGSPTGSRVDGKRGGTTVALLSREYPPPVGYTLLSRTRPNRYIYTYTPSLAHDAARRAFSRTRQRTRSGLAVLREISGVRRNERRIYGSCREREREKERGKWKEIEEPDGAHGRLRVYSRGSIHGTHSGRRCVGARIHYIEPPVSTRRSCACGNA